MLKQDGLRRSKLFAASAVLLLVGLAVGCNSGGRDGAGAGIPGLVQAAAALPGDNTDYRSSRLEDPRYSHSATTLSDGKVLIAGGSDERHFTSLDTGEVYDQTIFEDPQPESITGTFFNTDFNGDPIIMQQGGRIWHTATRLSDGNVLIAGGTRDILGGSTIEEAEIFDRQSRVFGPDFLQISGPMINPRFRHTATTLSSGQVLIAGGQLAADETIIDPNWPPGHPLFMVDIQTFPSTETMERFNPASLEFEPATDLQGNDTELQTTRGRSGHAAVQIGGVDNQLNTGDDLYLFAGGYRTFSSLFAPQTKFPNRSFDTFRVETLEYFDRTQGAVFTANNITMLARIATPHMFNIGRFNPVSPDGMLGMTNVAFLCNGNSDHGDANAFATSTTQGELISVTFDGFGPSDGIDFFVNTPVTAIAGVELAAATGCPNQPMGAPNFIGRTEAPAVQVPAVRNINGNDYFSSWIITMGGSNNWEGMTQQQSMATGCVAGDLLGFEYFDPFYNAAAVPPADPNDPVVTTTSPYGVTGSWLFASDTVAEDTLDGFALEGPRADASLPDGVVFHSASVVPGQDGILNTQDDRVVVIGGGDSWVLNGGEPTSINCVVFLPDGAND